MGITIHNIRLGKACNSSSSHSVIFLKDGQNIGSFNNEWDDNYYGWGFFALKGREEKIHYLIGMFFNSFKRNFGASGAQYILSNLFGVNLEFGYDPAEIDHQSQWVLPREYENQDRVDLNFVRELTDVVLRDNAVILGGNDNDGEMIEDDSEYDRHWFQDGINYDQSLICRKDKLTNQWTLFSKTTGAKIRFSFNDTTTAYGRRNEGGRVNKGADVTWASTPELVDFKITDYCPFDCYFCYQGSTRDGKHANIGTVMEYLDALHRMKVFEVALGGGEPTLNPDLDEIVEYAQEKGLSINLTTKNLKWLQTTFCEKKIYEKVGVAYSAQSLADVQEYTDFITEYRNKHRGVHGRYNFHVHIVMGVQPVAEVIEMVKLTQKAFTQVTLLGYKSTGRGGDTHIPYDKWLDEFVEAGVFTGWGTNIAIDTTLATQSKEMLERVLDSNDGDKITKTLVTYRDGGFSAYLDAVNQVWSPSSYEPTRPQVDLNMDGFRINGRQVMDEQLRSEYLAGLMSKEFLKWNESGQ